MSLIDESSESFNVAGFSFPPEGTSIFPSSRALSTTDVFSSTSSDPSRAVACRAAKNWSRRWVLGSSPPLDGARTGSSKVVAPG